MMYVCKQRVEREIVRVKDDDLDTTGESEPTTIFLYFFICAIYRLKLEILLLCLNKHNARMAIHFKSSCFPSRFAGSLSHVESLINNITSSEDCLQAPQYYFAINYQTNEAMVELAWVSPSSMRIQYKVLE
jgi:hypothetical protein